MTKFFTAALLCLSLQTVFAQSALTWVVESNSGGPLSGATISVQSKILITDDDGRATTEIAQGQVVYQVTYVGYYSIIDTVDHNLETEISVLMNPSEQMMEEVEVSGSREENDINAISTGHRVISAETIADLPYLLGERDPIKFIQTQAGVSNGTDGNNGYYVRGGGIDQNMIALDRMELYNANHLFGFFSMFNMEAIDRVDYYKSGYSANLGSRLSSSLLIHTKKPNFEEVEGSVTTGLLSAGLNFEVPVIKEKSGFLFSVRRSYLDLITQNAFSEGNNLRRKTDYRFTDFIAKYYHQINAKNTISLTSFGGGDSYHYKSRSFFSNDIEWSTYNVGLIWKHINSATSDLELYANAGQYNQQFKGALQLYEMDLNSSISNAKIGFQFNKDWLQLKTMFGGEAILREMKPNDAVLRVDDELFTLSEAPVIRILESALYWDGEWSVLEQTKIGVGARLSGFAMIGDFDRFNVSDDGVIVDTSSFGNGEVVSKYFNLEPRFRISHLLDPNRSVRFSYDRNNQYVHLSPLSSVSLPTDVWVPSSNRIKPQASDQFTFGYHELLNSRNLKISTSIYYKRLTNQVEYRNGAISGYSSSYNFDDDFVFGKGRSYGLELSVSKEVGEFQYEVNYTLSRTVRSFKEIQDAQYFPAKYDRTHDLNVIGNYPYGKWKFSGLFKLTSGNAMTLPTAKYLIEGNVVSEYSKRNSYRMPIYHRLDLSASLEAGKRGNALWIFSVYNVYNRKNPFYVYFEVEGNANEYKLDIDLQKVDLFPVLPSVSYQLRF